MLNRKESKLANRPRSKKKALEAKAPPPRRHRFVLSPGRKARQESQPSANGVVTEKNGKNGAAEQNTLAKAAYANSHQAATAGAAALPFDMVNLVKNLVQLAREQGHLTFDDINDLLPDGLSPDDLDEL